MPELSDLLHDAGGDVEPLELGEVRARVQRRLRRRTVLRMGGAGVAALAVVVALVSLGDDETSGVLTDRTTTTVAPAPGGQATMQRFAGHGDSVVAGLGGVWLAQGLNEAGDGGTVVRVDPATGATVATITTGGPAHWLGIGFGSVWVAGGGDGAVPIGVISRVDPLTNKVVASIQLSEPWTPYALAFTKHALWVADASRRLVLRIDPTTNTIVNEIAVPGQPSSLAANPLQSDALYVAVDTTATSQVFEIDARAGAVSAPVTLEGSEVEATIGGSLWSYSFAGRALQGLPAGHARVDVHVGQGGQLVADVDGVWFGDQEGIRKLDDRGVQVVDPIPGTGPVASFAVAPDGTVWVLTDSMPAELLRVTPAHRGGACPRASTPLGGGPDAADALPPAEGVVTDVSQAQSIVTAFRAGSLTPVALAHRNGEVWRKDAAGRVTTELASDFEILVTLRSARDCPGTASVYNGLRVDYEVDR